MAYNHAMTLAFEVVSERKDGEDLTPAQIRAAIQKRLDEMPDEEMKEACLPPYDSYETDVDQLPEGVEAVCENCGKPCEYDSEMCLCRKCEAEES